MGERNILCSKLSQCRDVCKGMNIPEEAFKTSEYIVANFYEEYYSAVDLAVALAKTIEEQDMSEMALYFLQIIDIVADDAEFAETFREICSIAFRNLPPRIVKEEEYPKYAMMAADWWYEEITFHSSDNLPKAFLRALSKQYYESDIKLFKQTLAKEIVKEVEENGQCYLYSDWSPDEILSIAGRKLGIDANIGYPRKTMMMVFETEIRFSRNGTEKYTIVEVKD